MPSDGETRRDVMGPSSLVLGLGSDEYDVVGLGRKGVGCFGAKISGFGAED